MEVPICLSKNFVNKQNIRSFGNIIKMKILKNDDSTPFLHLVIEDKQLVSGLPVNVREFLTTLKTTLLANTKDDFKKFFLDIKTGDSLSSLNKADIFKSCLAALYEIIPKYFFGGHNNMKVFQNIVRTVIYSMKSQHLIFGPLIDKWDFQRVFWKTMEPETGRKVLQCILLWIIQYVLSPMISLNFYVATCKIDADEYKLHFFWKSQWQSFYNKNISDMIFSKVLKRYEPYCMGKKCKRNYDHIERRQIKSNQIAIPKLHLVLKPNNDYRPIVRYKSGKQTASASEKYKLKEKLNFFKTLTGKPQMKIEMQYKCIYQEWLKKGKPKLYFIKSDLSNAFGTINREKLMKMLQYRHMVYQKTEKNAYMQKKTAQHYDEMIKELRKPILVRAGSTVYEWREGLVQGYKYSPALSELYYTCLDETYFAEHLTNPDSRINFFTRVVDDYLYITDSLDDAHLFLNALSQHRNVNYSKTFVNFEQEHIKYSDEITFLGNSYNTKTLEVSRASNIYVGQMCYKIAFTTAMANKSKFLENRVGQSGINGHIFNLQYNTEEFVWKHIFTTFLLSANRFCTILAVLCEQREMLQYVALYKKRVAVKLTNTMLETLLKNKPSDCIFYYCINHFRYLAFKALYLIAKETPRCRGIIGMVNDEMSKSNCLFGKWRDHAARIGPSGTSHRPAVREVCRRLDLRVIVKKMFDSLPAGIKCYNSKLL